MRIALADGLFAVLSSPCAKASPKALGEARRFRERARSCRVSSAVSLAFGMRLVFDEANGALAAQDAADGVKRAHRVSPHPDSRRGRDGTDRARMARTSVLPGEGDRGPEDELVNAGPGRVPRRRFRQFRLRSSLEMLKARPSCKAVCWSDWANCCAKSRSRKSSPAFKSSPRPT